MVRMFWVLGILAGLSQEGSAAQAKQSIVSEMKALLEKENQEKKKAGNEKPSPQASQQNTEASSSSSSETKKSPIIVLSVDGAAVRGIAQFELLLAIQREVNNALANAAPINAEGEKKIERESITDIFDFFAGTSAGSVNVGGMLIPADYSLANTPGHVTKPQFTLDKLKLRLPETLKAAFSSSTFHKLRTLQIPGVGGLLGSKFTAGEFEGLLQELAGNARISDLAKPAVLTSYDLRGREVMNFSTHDACAIGKDDVIRFQRPGSTDFFRKDKNVLIWQAIRASSAAPVFYNPLEIEIGGKQRALIDAGLFVMSPALLAWIEAQKVYPGRPLIIISISSGTLLEARKVDTKGLAAGSVPKVVQPTIETALEGQQALTDLMMRDLPGIQYYRLSFDVKNKQFDDTSEKNMKALIEAANVTIASKAFKDVIDVISKARLERKEKKDLEPYICQAKERQRENRKSLIPAHKVDTLAGITDDKIIRKIEEAYKEQETDKKQKKPIPEEMKEQIQLLKTDCQNLLKQKKTNTLQWKNSHCDNVMSPKEICDGLFIQKQTKEWKNRGCKMIMKQKQTI